MGKIKKLELRDLISKRLKDLLVIEGKSKKFLGGINDDIRIIN